MALVRAQRSYADIPLLLIGALLGSSGPDDRRDEGQMTLVEHLDELRGRLIKSVLAVGVATALAFWRADQLLTLLLLPAGKDKIFVDGPTGGLVLSFQIALAAGCALASPVVFYQAVAFVLPAMTPRERRVFLTTLPLVVCLLVAGVLFGYAIALPFALTYLLGYTMGSQVEFLLRSGPYIDFVTALLLGFGLAFELPAVLWVLARLGLVTTARLVALRRYAFLAAFVIAAIITPTPDPLNQLLLAVPLYLLYEAGILLSRLR
jgi:sec-independent protein translocase protein TatC